MKVKCRSLTAFKVVLGGKWHTLTNGDIVEAEEKEIRSLVKDGYFAIIKETPSVKILKKPKINSKKAVK